MLGLGAAAAGEGLWNRRSHSEEQAYHREFVERSKWRRILPARQIREQTAQGGGAAREVNEVEGIVGMLEGAELGTAYATYPVPAGNGAIGAIIGFVGKGDDGK